jgi:hypothetical protein
MPDDIRDLLGRYAAGSLTAEEQKRLFDAALDDQDLFDQLAREQDVKRLLEEPGARSRMIRALQRPRRRLPWVLVLAPVATVIAVLLVVLMRPVPKPQQVAVAVQPPARATEIAKTEPEPAPVKARIAPPTDSPATPPVAEPRKDAENQVADRKQESAERDELKKAAPPSEPLVAAQQYAPGGPRQQAASGGAKQKVQQSRSPLASGAASALSPSFGFHYSIETKGHLIIVPSADGYLSVKSNTGAVLFDPQQIAAGIAVDIPLPPAPTSVTIAFSATSTQVGATPTPRTAPEGTAQGATVVAITLQLNQ